MKNSFPYHRFPEGAHDFSYFLWDQFKFKFVVSKNRKTKLGDFRYDPSRKVIYTITVNYDLNPFSFFITYLHEVAHLMVNKKFGQRVQPHGKEWKTVFGSLLKKALEINIFPPKLAYVVSHFAQNPGASVVASPMLYEALKEYDTESKGVLLKYLTNGSYFVFNGELFQRKELRRTRVKCLKVSNKKEYLLSVLAEVEPRI